MPFVKVRRLFGIRSVERWSGFTLSGFMNAPCICVRVFISKCIQRWLHEVNYGISSFKRECSLYCCILFHRPTSNAFQKCRRGQKFMFLLQVNSLFFNYRQQRYAMMSSSYFEIKIFLVDELIDEIWSIHHFLYPNGMCVSVVMVW